MSVINRMLQELEQRHDETQERMPGVVRAVPARLSATSYRAGLWGGAIVGLALLLGILGWRVAVSWKAHKTSPAAVTAPTPIIPAVPAPRPHLKPSVTLERAPAVGGNIVAAPMPVAPEPVAAPAAKPDREAMLAKPKTAPEKLPPALPVPAVAASPAVPGSVTPEAIIKTRPTSTEAPVSNNVKQVSVAQRSDFHYREALSFITQGRMQEAQEALEAALRIEPKNLDARQVLLSLLVDEKRYPQAEQLLRAGLQLNLAPAAQAAALARVQMERGDQAAALATLEQYAPQAGKDSEYHGFYAALLQRAGRHAEAIQQFQAALNIQPHQATWLMGLGISLQAEKRNTEAAQAYSQAYAANTLAPDLQAFVAQRLQQVRQAK